MLLEALLTVVVFAKSIAGIVGSIILTVGATDIGVTFTNWVMGVLAVLFVLIVEFVVALFVEFCIIVLLIIVVSTVTV